MAVPASPLPPARRWWPRVWDGALFVIGFFVTTIAITNVPGVHDGDSLTDLGVAVWLLAIGAWVTVLFRRTRPWLTAAAGLALAGIGSEYLLMLIGVFHLMLTRRGRERIAIGAGAVVVVGMYWVRETTSVWGGDVFDLDDGSGVSPTMASAAIALLSLGITAGATALAFSRRATADARDRAEAEHARADQLGDEVARQAEREEIAREIHDGLTNRLALLAMMGGNLERAVNRGDDGADELARQLRTQSREALADLRGLVQDLRAAPADVPPPRGTMRDIPTLIADARAAGTDIHAIVLLEDAGEAPAALGAAVHRTVQESITNAIKHAPGAVVSLYLEAAPGRDVRLRITNPLASDAGAGTPRGAGVGLLGIGERAAALGGTAWTGAHDDEFIVDVTIPWAVAPEEALAGVSEPDPTLEP
ncbi:sensor histidine kinase [Demequina gelatinilytica]|uniref:sensor histidine kinase n=1 Tax=Demequina gelatinilytica TaxID=1638980 RepID=UPI000783811E|nr:histidine kinase [Demequina gelatinilytica]